MQLLLVWARLRNADAGKDEATLLRALVSQCFGQGAHAERAWPYKSRADCLCNWRLHLFWFSPAHLLCGEKWSSMLRLC